MDRPSLPVPTTDDARHCRFSNAETGAKAGEGAAIEGKRPHPVGRRGYPRVTDAVSTFEDDLRESLRDIQRLVPDDHGAVPAEAVAKLRDAGLFAASLPREAGGLGLCEPASASRFRQVLTAVGRASQVIGRLYEGHANAHALIFRYGGGGGAGRRDRGHAGRPSLRRLEHRAAR